jgi:hypothetical protein
VVIEPPGQNQVEHRRKLGLRLNVAAGFRDVVIVFVAAMDRTVGPRYGPDEVGSIYEPLPLAEIRRVLNLAREKQRIVVYQVGIA